MKKQTYEHNLIEYDSKEEIEFVMWVEEAAEAGFIRDCQYHPITWEITPKVTYPVTKQLKTKSKLVDKFLLHPLTYEPDFKIEFNESFFSTFGEDALSNIARMETKNQLGQVLETIYRSPDIWIDVKGIFNQQDAHRRFSVIQKVIFDKMGTYVNMVIPEKFFNKTFVPSNCAWMKNRIEPTRRKAYIKCKLLSEIKIKQPTQPQQTEIIL